MSRKDTVMLPKYAIRQAVSSVLKEFDIDNLALEGSIATEVYAIFQRLESGEDQDLVQSDIVDEYLSTHAKQKYRANLIERIGASLRININNEDAWEKVLKFLEKKEREKQQTIERFHDWLEDYKFGPPVWKIAQKPDMIIQIWPQAFPEGVQQEMDFAQREDGGFDL